jgi:hypothetical protein
MFDENKSYNDETQQKYNVSEKDLSEYADYRLGKEIKQYFDDNLEEYNCYFEAEI